MVGAAVFFAAAAAAQAIGGKVTLAWDASDSASVAGYRVLYGYAPGQYSDFLDVGDSLEATVPDLKVGTEYFFAVVAYNQSRLESAPSEEVPYVVPNQLPKVAITWPADGASFNVSTQLSINASGIDPDGTITKVEFYDGATLLGHDSEAPYELPFTAAEAGTRRIRAVGYDSDGGVARSGEVTVNLVALQTSHARRLTEGSFEFKITGAPGWPSKIWVSEDLKTWSVLAEVMNETGALVVSDPEAARASNRFYRVTAE